MTEWMRGGVITLCLAAVLFLLGVAADNEDLLTVAYMAGVVGLAFVVVAVARGSSSAK